MKYLFINYLLIISLNAQTVKFVEPTNITNLHKNTGEIILTIDDGPTRVTSRLLDILNDKGVKATFFVLGKNIKRYPRVMDRMLAEGHIIANHTDSHIDLRKASEARIKLEIEKTYREAFPYFGNGDYLYFRSPYGSWDKRVSRIVNKTKYARDMRGPIFWDIGGTLTISGGYISRAADWNCWSKGLSVNQCLQGYINETKRHNGGVALFHDIKLNSVNLIDKYITQMKTRGFKFVSLDKVKL